MLCSLEVIWSCQQAETDGIAKLWNLTSGMCIKGFPSKHRGMACVEFSLDSRTILAGGNDQVIYQFDTNTGELVKDLKGHGNLVRSLHLDSCNGRVISGSYDFSVRAFDLRNGEPIVNFVNWTSSWILSAKADFRRIIATSQDNRAVIMDFGYQLPGVESLGGRISIARRWMWKGCELWLHTNAFNQSSLIEKFSDPERSIVDRSSEVLLKPRCVYDKIYHVHIEMNSGFTT